MAISKLNFNSLNVTPSASSAIGFDSGADDLETGAGGGSMIFIKKLTASSSGTLSFVDGSSSVVLDNTYKEYVFIFNNLHSSSNTGLFQVNFSVDTGSNYNVVKTSTCIQAYHTESDSEAALGYAGSYDLAQSANFLTLNFVSGTDNDESTSGVFTLFNPSSTTFVKHFISRVQGTEGSGYSMDFSVAGYGNTTSAIDAVQFKMSTGNIDAGTITLYGIN